MPSSGSGSADETMAFQALYEKALEGASTSPELQKRSWNRITTYKTETHDLIEGLLGKAKTEEVTKSDEWTVSPETISEIVGIATETKAGIAHVIRNAIDDPKEAEVTLSSGKKKIKDLVRDSGSDDARILAWYFENMATSSEKEKAFAYVSNATEAKKLAELIDARKAYDRLLENPENFNLGKKGATPRNSSTKIGALEDQLDEARADAAAASAEIARLTSGPAAATVNISGYQEQQKQANKDQRELKGKVELLEQKRIDLATEIGDFESILGSIGMTLPAPTADLSASLNKTNLANRVKSGVGMVTIAGDTKKISEHLTEKSVRSRDDELHSIISRSGTQKPNARDVLNRVMKAEYKGALKSMSEEAAAKFLDDVYRVMAKRNVAKKDEKKKEEEKKDARGDHDKGGHGKSWFGSFYDYMTEEGSSYLGWYTKPKDGKHH